MEALLRIVRGEGQKKAALMLNYSTLYLVCTLEGSAPIEKVKTKNGFIWQSNLPQINYYQEYNMNTGTVKFFNESKGFGFIKDENSNKEYFVHVTGLIDEVEEGDEVTYELEEGRKGLNAVKVQLAE